MIDEGSDVYNFVSIKDIVNLCKLLRAMYFFF